MYRADKRKPLTPELKGSLITLYNFGFSYNQIAERIDCNVSFFAMVFLFNKKIEIY